MTAVGLRRSGQAQTRVLCQVETDAGGWYDLTAVYDANGDGIIAPRLEACSDLEVKLEAASGIWDISAVTLTFWNGDRFFNGPPPSGISSWYRRRFRLQERTDDGAITTRAYLYSTDAPTTASDSDVATIPCESILGRLKDKRASAVKAGQSPFTNARISTLVQEVLKQEFPATTVDAWVAAGAILDRYTIPLADSSTKAVSHLGRLPETANVPGTWYGNALCYVSDASAATALKNKLVFGAGGEVWTWNPSTEAEARVLSLASDLGLASTYQVQHLYWCTSSHKLIGVAWQPDIPAATVNGTAARDRTGAKSGTVRFFRTDGTTHELFAAPSLGGSRTIWTGHVAVRAGGYTASPYTRIGGIGSDADCAGANMPMPWAQWLQRVYGTATDYAFLTGLETGTPPNTTPTGCITTWTGKAWGAKTQGQGGRLSHERMDGGGWWAFKYDDGGAVDRRPLNFTWNCGQHQGAFAQQTSGAYLAFWSIEWDSGTNKYVFRLWRLDVTSTAATPTYQYYHTDGTPGWGTTGTALTTNAQPYAMDFSADDTLLAVGAAEWSEAAWSGSAPPANSVIGTVLAYTWATPTTTTTYFDSSGTVAPTDWSGTSLQLAIPLGVRYAGSTSYIACTFLHPDTLLFEAGVLATGGGTAAARWAHGRVSAGLPMGLLHADSAFWWLDSAPNVLIAASDTAASDPTLQSGGDNPVYQDPCVVAGLVTTGSGTYYAISAPGAGTQGQPDVYGSELPGKYYLWQYATSLADRVECFQYTGAETLLDALADLARLCDAQVYADVANDRVCVLPRATGTSFSQVFTAAGLALDYTAADGFTETYVGERISAQPAMKDIANYVEMTPARAALGAPSAATRTATRPDGWEGEPFDAAVPVAQHGVQTVSLVLRCTHGAAAGAYDDGAVATTRALAAVSDTASPYHKLRFAYLEIGATIEAALLSAYTSGTTVDIALARADGVAVGSLVTFPAVGTGTLALERTVTAVDTTTTSGRATLTVDSSLGRTYADGTHITIRTAQHNRWSDTDDGVTTLALALPAAEPTISDAGGISATDTTIGLSSVTGVDAGTILLAGTERIYVGGVSGANATSCVRGYQNTTAATHADGSALTILTARFDSLAPLGIFAVLAIGTGTSREELRYTGDTGDGVHGYVTRAVGGTSRAAHAVSDAVRAYWAPIISTDYPAGTMFGVGGTGVTATIAMPAATSTVPEHAPMVGDEITLTCPGLTLQRDEASRVVALDQDSIDRYGKRPWNGRASALASYRQCVEAAARVVSDQRWPHIVAVWEGPRVTDPGLRTCYGVRSRLELPWVESTTTPQGESWGAATTPDTNREIGCMPRAIRYGLFTDQLRVTLRAVNATEAR